MTEQTTIAAEEVAPLLPQFSDNEPRNGQWCKFKLNPNDAQVLAGMGGHVTADGYFLGVYIRGGKDSLGAPHPTRIEPVNKAGVQVRYLSEDQSTVCVASLSPTGAIDLHPMLDRNDVPAPRLATMAPDWNPSA